MICHGFLPLLSQDFIKTVHFFADIKNLSIGLENPHFLTLSAECPECKI